MGLLVTCNMCYNPEKKEELIFNTNTPMLDRKKSLEDRQRLSKEKEFRQMLCNNF